MATLQQTQAQTRRQLLEATRAMTEAILHSGERPDALRGRLLDIYNLGRNHANERLALRLEIPYGVDAVVINWPGDNCPSQPHAHVRFDVDNGDVDLDQPQVH